MQFPRPSQPTAQPTQRAIPVRDYLLQMLEAASDWLLPGLDHADERATRAMQRLHAHSEALGAFIEASLLVQEMTLKAAQGH